MITRPLPFFQSQSARQRVIDEQPNDLKRYLNSLTVIELKNFVAGSSGEHRMIRIFDRMRKEGYNHKNKEKAKPFNSIIKDVSTVLANHLREETKEVITNITHQIRSAEKGNDYPTAHKLQLLLERVGQLESKIDTQNTSSAQVIKTFDNNLREITDEYYNLITVKRWEYLSSNVKELDSYITNNINTSLHASVSNCLKQEQHELEKVKNRMNKHRHLFLSPEDISTYNTQVNSIRAEAKGITGEIQCFSTKL